MKQPVLYGLVLAGGKSTRMGKDKARISWHGKEQQYFVADLLKNLCDEVFISCRAEQVSAIDPAYQTLPDLVFNSGPYEAILSAFKHQLNCAWLVAACDLPLLDLQTLQYLVQQRNPGKIATVFESLHDNLPEPLIAIWEPASYLLLNVSPENKRISLRKLLLENSAQIIKAPDEGALTNVNTPEDVAKTADLIRKKLMP